MDAILEQLGTDSRRDLTICRIAIEADMANAVARQVAALPQPLRTLAELERASLRAGLEAAMAEMLREGAPILPHEQQPITPKPAPAEPIAPAAEVPATPAPPPSRPSLAPLFNPFFCFDPLGCRGW
jgi:hypothetical protein